jgi:mannose-6-phosphate isomerase-like protein (cupin superfamily)
MNESDQPREDLGDRPAMTEGEVVTDDDRTKVVIKAGITEIAVTESIYAPGESGPDAHVHHEHVDAFYVLAGQLVFEVGPALERALAGPGMFVLVPPNVVHTFRNEGPEDARFINIHSPSKDFHRQLRGEDVDFDTSDPPEDGGHPASDVIVRGRTA